MRVFGTDPFVTAKYFEPAKVRIVQAGIVQVRIVQVQIVPDANSPGANRPECESSGCELSRARVVRVRIVLTELRIHEGHIVIAYSGPFNLEILATALKKVTQTT